MNKSIFFDELIALQDNQYKAFNSNLLPTIQQDSIIGIRVPHLRMLAKKLFKTDHARCFLFLNNTPHTYLEENHLHAFLIGHINDISDCLEETDRFLPYIDNWQTCDLFSPKVFKTHPEKVYTHIQKWIKSSHPFTQRYAIHILLSNYRTDHFHREHLTLVSSVKSKHYYVNMMIAWYFSMIFINHFDDTLPYLTNHKLTPWCHNKAIQKIIESHQFTKEQKDFFRTLRRK